MSQRLPLCYSAIYFVFSITWGEKYSDNVSEIRLYLSVYVFLINFYFPLVLFEICCTLFSLEVLTDTTFLSLLL